MPLTLHPDLRDCLERPNPYVEYRIEISEPDVGQVLRRQDQFTQAPSLVSLSPALSLSASARGALILTPSTLALATFSGTGSSFDLNGENPNRRLKGVSWTLDSAFSQATLKSVQAKVQRVPLAGFFFDTDFECQVFQITRTPGVKVKNVGTPQYQSVAFTDYAFAPLLNPAPTLKASAQSWDGSQIATLSFDLSNFRLVLENIPGRAVAAEQTGLLPQYLIVVRLAGKPLSGTGRYKWLTDTVASHAVAGVGTFDRVFWAKDSDEAQWAETVSADVPNLVLNIESYPASGQGIYLIDQGAAPNAASTGRIEFQRSLPSGTSATLEISTAGSGGPWTVVKHGDPVSVKQQTYHLRTTLTSDATQRASPEILAQGVEFRTPHDVSIEAIPALPSREVDLPWPRASIPEGKVRIVRTGSRDYLDVGSVLGSTSATSRLEADIFLSSRHPSITRDKWFRLERMMVTNRTPSATSEEFTLLSYASRLKRKIPQKVETISSVHVVTSSTTAQVTINGATPLPGTTASGNEYDGRNYYMRVRSTGAAEIPVGYVAVIQGNTNTTKLDFTPALPQALVAGDVVEVHSGIFQTQAVSWNNADPADVWWELLTSLLAVPPERVGLGSLPRGGLPPRVTDIAPGDATTQAKRLITGRLFEEVSGDEVVDIISGLLGGVTLEIAGQMVFVQIIPLLDAAGAVTVPLPPPAAVFDSRDFSSPPQTPLGLEKRATVVTAKYGVPATSASPDSFPSKATTAVDSDALLWLAQQDLEDYGTAEVPDEITKWLYNTTDEGLYLASVLGAQLVRVASTGLRVFGLSMAEKHPTLVPGDVIVISLDSYTDFDPSTLTEIKGPISIRGVLTRVGNEGRQLSMFVPGLRDNVQLVQGGLEGSRPGMDAVVPELRILNFREIERTATELKLGWTVTGDVEEIWLYLSDQAQPITSDPWALLSGVPTMRLSSDTTSVTVAIPKVGRIVYGRLVPMSTALERGWAWDFTVQPNDATPDISLPIQLVAPGGLTVDLKFTVTDPAGLGGTLSVWTNHDLTADADSSAAAEGSKIVASTDPPYEASSVTVFDLPAGGTANLLDNIKVHPGKGKRVFAEFVNAAGISSGIQAILLQPGTSPVDDDNELIAGIIHDYTPFASGITPIKIVAALPGTGEFVGQIVLLTTDNKIYRWTGTVWTAAVATIDLTGTINTGQIADVAITAAKIGALAVETAKIAALAVTAGKIAIHTITANEIAALTITAAEIAAGAIIAAKIGAGEVTAGKIAALSIVAGDIAALTITGAKIAAGAISADKIVANAITAGQIQAGAIGTTELAALAVTAAKIAAGTITADKLNVSSLSAISAELGTVTVTEGASAITFMSGASEAAQINAWSDATRIGLTMRVAGGANILNALNTVATGEHTLVLLPTRLDLSATYIGFFGTAPILKPTVTGSRGGNAALASLLTQLANLGLVFNSST